MHPHYCTVFLNQYSRGKIAGSQQKTLLYTTEGVYCTIRSSTISIDNDVNGTSGVVQCGDFDEECVSSGLEENAKLFSKVVVPIYISTISV